MAIILSLNPQGHDAGAALVRDGRLVAAALEERFTRVKHHATLPVHSARFCLQHAGVGIADVDHFVYPYSDKLFVKYGRARILRSLGRLHEGPTAALRSIYAQLPKTSRAANRSVFSSWFAETMRAAGHDARGVEDRVRFTPHHLAHAAGAFAFSGFDEAAVLVVDGQGETVSTSFSRAHGATITTLRSERVENSLGYYYSAVTRYLGWEHNEGEGKTMGLAPYGREGVVDVRPLLREEGELWRVEPKLSDYVHDPIVHVERAVGHPRRRAGSPLDSPYPDVARAAQDALDQAMIRAARHAMDLAATDRLCLSGGVALNCKANMAMREGAKPRDLYIMAAAGDGGATVGAALALASELGDPIRQRVDHDSWGPEYSAEEIERILVERKIRHERPPDIAKAAADLVAEGAIIGWFQGRMELGPRSLGNRAILADPREEATRDRVNALKMRESWRPLCPSMLAERAEEYLEDACHAPFMILSFRVREDKRKEIAAAVHVDGTTRPQTVTREANPLYHRFLSEFETRAGIPAVLNTSFNLAGYPIVATPLQALADYFVLGLDALAIGPFLVRR
ncbi:MAG TPA: carbamoyltransferase C-terminal domain-containing protein [Candidatus Thermoplasmatota archaeon]|nr:carbamoyltransferase C-terminal domain-containing protein [Candidatus Thermoplasmatota archaeon]